jgi:HSP20 family molecular chaperone IbpA
MAKSKVQVESKSAAVSTSNVADAVIEIARDAYHGHLDTIGRLSDVFIPTSLGTILRHDVPTFGRLTFGFPCPLDFRSFAKQASGIFSGSSQVSDEGDAYAVSFTVPGYEVSELDVLVSSNGITVKSKASDNDNQIVLGRWTAPEDIDPSGANASLDNGILKVVVEKREDKKAVRVPITPA